MENIYSRELTVHTSLCDSSGRLGIADTFALFMDIAAEHAETLGLGGAAMAEKNAFWLTVRTRVTFNKRPYMTQTVTAETWPMAPGVSRCDRSYLLKRGGSILAEGRTEWAVLDLKSGRVCELDAIGFPKLEWIERQAAGGPFTKLKDDLSENELLCEITVRPSDIDIGAHTNNTAYIRMLTDTIPTKELNSLRVSELEIVFCKPSYEGETLRIFRRDAEHGKLFAVRNASGDTVVIARMLIE